MHTIILLPFVCLCGFSLTLLSFVFTKLNHCRDGGITIFGDNKNLTGQDPEQPVLMTKPCFWAGAWTRWPPDVPFRLNYSVINIYSLEHLGWMNVQISLYKSISCSTLIAKQWITCNILLLSLWLMNHYFISRERCDTLQNLVQWHLFLHTTVLRFNWVREPFSSFGPGHKVSASDYLFWLIATGFFHSRF